MSFWLNTATTLGRVKNKGRQMNMCQKTSRVFRCLVSAFGLGAVIGWSSPSNAYIQQLVIDQTATVTFTAIMLGTSTPGSATSYTIYTGRIFGELKPNDPDNKIITDIYLAPKNKDRVEYIANFDDYHTNRSSRAQRTNDPRGAKPRRQRDQYKCADPGCDLCSEWLAGRPSGAMLAVPGDPISLL
jgi:hypothetical protein